MAPGGRPSITIGIQPQIALYTVILGSVCAFGWYTEKYRRDEDDIDGNVKKVYLSDVREAREKLPQMTATIRGQDVQRVDNEMNKLVWGGKAHISDIQSGTAFGGGFGGKTTSKADKHADDDDDDTTTRQKIVIPRRNISSRSTLSSSSEDDNDNSISSSKTLRKEKKRRKRKGKKLKEEEEARQLAQEAERKKLIVQSTIAGVAVGAVVVTAMTFAMGTSRSR